jgi:hypothetical protein
MENTGRQKGFRELREIFDDAVSAQQDGGSPEAHKE